jgi:hypothetical protein
LEGVEADLAGERGVGRRGGADDERSLRGHELVG